MFPFLDMFAQIVGPVNLFHRALKCSHIDDSKQILENFDPLLICNPITVFLNRAVVA
jgi:hypothetical protein